MYSVSHVCGINQHHMSRETLDTKHSWRMQIKIWGYVCEACNRYNVSNSRSEPSTLLVCFFDNLHTSGIRFTFPESCLLLSHQGNLDLEMTSSMLLRILQADGPPHS